MSDSSAVGPFQGRSLAFKFYYAFVVLMRARCEVLERERHTGWVRELAETK